MVKFILILVLFVGFSSNIFSQSRIIPKDVEAKIMRNREEVKQKYDGVLIVFSFPNSEILTREKARQFDALVLSRNKNIVKSCNTGESGGVYTTVIIAEGYLVEDDLKQIVMDSYGSVSTWSMIYTLSENVTISTTPLDVRHEISGEEYDNMPLEKRQHIQENLDKYKIVYK